MLQTLECLGISSVDLVLLKKFYLNPLYGILLT